MAAGFGAGTMRAGGSAPRRSLVFNPHGGERLLDVLQMKQEAENKLISEDRLSRDDQRHRELDVIVQGECVNRWFPARVSISLACSLT